MDAQQTQMDIDEKLKNEYLGLFKRFNNNQYDVEVSNPTNNSFIIKLTKDGTTKSFIFDVRRKFNNEIENMSIRLSRNDKLYSQTFTDDKNIYSIKYENNQWSHNVVPKISS
ncbi:hypothetical protein KBB05_05430 [Patescibacteria group bacterium]|nr:hypothetical protein [Patescibacteria group bacterium]